MFGKLDIYKSQVPLYNHVIRSSSGYIRYFQFSSSFLQSFIDFTPFFLVRSTNKPITALSLMSQAEMCQGRGDAELYVIKDLVYQEVLIFRETRLWKQKQRKRDGNIYFWPAHVCSALFILVLQQNWQIQLQNHENKNQLSWAINWPCSFHLSDTARNHSELTWVRAHIKYLHERVGDSHGNLKRFMNTEYNI